jgi:hypothetical protein
VSQRRQGEKSPRLTRPREGDIKRRRVEEYLAGLGSGQLGVATDSSVCADMAAAGVRLSVRYAGRILEEWRFDHGVPAPGVRWR